MSKQNPDLKALQKRLQRNKKGMRFRSSVEPPNILTEARFPDPEAFVFACALIPGDKGKLAEKELPEKYPTRTSPDRIRCDVAKIHGPGNYVLYISHAALEQPVFLAAFAVIDGNLFRPRL